MYAFILQVCLAKYTRWWYYANKGQKIWYSNTAYVYECRKCFVFGLWSYLNDWSLKYLSHLLVNDTIITSWPKITEWKICGIWWHSKSVRSESGWSSRHRYQVTCWEADETGLDALRLKKFLCSPKRVNRVSVLSEMGNVVFLPEGKASRPWWQALTYT